MKDLLNRYRLYILIPITVYLVSAGMQNEFYYFTMYKEEFAKYPTIFAAMSLLLIYIIPLGFILRYLQKRFDISSELLIFAVILSLTIPGNLGLIGNDWLYNFWAMIDPNNTFLSNWSAALTAPFAEEFAKVVPPLLIALFYRKLTVKEIFLLGLIAGFGFQITEDIAYISNAVFDPEAHLMSMTFTRIAGWPSTHSIYSALFTLGFLALIGKTPALSKKQAVCYLFAGLGLHFIWNSPLSSMATLTSQSTVNWLVFIPACIFVYKLPKEKDVMIF